MSQSKAKNILILMTGSIACYKVCHVLSRLKQQGHLVKVVMSPSSLEFIGRATIEGLTGEAPITDMYASNSVMDHINLIRWAELVLVAPATANYVNKIASGLGDDLLTTLFLAHNFDKPFLLAPAMNTKMYLHPVTQNSIQKLRAMGVEILETASGVLACGEIGSGRLLEPDLILAEIARYLEQPQVRSAEEAVKKYLTSDTPKILITAGGTTEPIDDVRVITNKSTGRTAAALADRLIEAGFNVIYLHANHAIKPNFSCETQSFSDFKSLEQQLFSLLKVEKFSTVIHTAAVSDYSPTPFVGKISSSPDEITLTLKKNPKLINQIKKILPDCQLIGFKLTSQLDEATIQLKVNSLFENAHCDYVVQNDWSEVQNNHAQYRFYSHTQPAIYQTANSANSLHNIIFQALLTKGTL